ncbi:MAG: GTPase [archaeon]
MPINAGHEYLTAEARYQAAKTPEEKLKCLQEMLRTAPKHKGSENLLAEITNKIKRIKNQMEKIEAQRKKASAKSLAIKKEGVAQVVLIGMTNSGKSTLIKTLTNNKDILIAPYAFTTKKPEIGMMDYKKAQVQLVEIPPLVQGSGQGKAAGLELLAIVRNADAVVFVLNACNAVKEYDIVNNELKFVDILINKIRPRISVNKSDFKGITFSGKNYLKVTEEEVVNFLKANGYHNASLVIEQPCSLKDISEALNNRLCYKRGIALINERSCALEGDELQDIKQRIHFIKYKTLDEKELNRIREEIFQLLGKILIFTKKPSEEAAIEPLAIPENATVEDVAKIVHKDLYKKFKFARVWGSTKFAGQRVSKDYVLRDQDTVEIYI